MGRVFVNAQCSQPGHHRGGKPCSQTRYLGAGVRLRKWHSTYEKLFLSLVLFRLPPLAGKDTQLDLKQSLLLARLLSLSRPSCVSDFTPPGVTNPELQELALPLGVSGLKAANGSPRCSFSLGASWQYYKELGIFKKKS